MLNEVSAGQLSTFFLKLNRGQQFCGQRSKSVTVLTQIITPVVQTLRINITLRYSKIDGSNLFTSSQTRQLTGSIRLSLSQEELLCSSITGAHSATQSGNDIDQYITFSTAPAENCTQSRELTVTWRAFIGFIKHLIDKICV
ncbi:hypothetical protein ACUNI5_20190 [Serratia sp. IR-2025]